MAEYVNREKVLNICEEHYQHCLEMHDYCGDATAGNIKEDVEKLPIADVAEVKHGEWIQGVPYRCSICGKPAPEEKNTSEIYSCWASPYCPRCGAKMDGRSDV